MQTSTILSKVVLVENCCLFHYSEPLLVHTTTSTSPFTTILIVVAIIIAAVVGSVAGVSLLIGSGPVATRSGAARAAISRCRRGGRCSSGRGSSSSGTVLLRQRAKNLREIQVTESLRGQRRAQRSTATATTRGRRRSSSSRRVQSGVKTFSKIRECLRKESSSEKC